MARKEREVVRVLWTKLCEQKKDLQRSHPSSMKFIYYTSWLSDQLRNATLIAWFYGSASVEYLARSHELDQRSVHGHEVNLVLLHDSWIVTPVLTLLVFN